MLVCENERPSTAMFYVPQQMCRFIFQNVVNQIRVISTGGGGVTCESLRFLPVSRPR